MTINCPNVKRKIKNEKKPDPKKNIQDKSGHRKSKQNQREQNISFRISKSAITTLIEKITQHINTHNPNFKYCNYINIYKL